MMEIAANLIEETANITLTRQFGAGGSNYTDNAQILLGNYTSGTATSYSGWGQYNFYLSGGIYTRAGKVWLDGTDSFVNAPTNFNNGQRLYLHEFLHVLGLSHPGNYNVTDPGYSYANSAVYVEDSYQYTVMSYFDESETAANFGNNGGMTPLLHDIAALQRLYGANMTTRTGNTVYGFDSNTGYEAYAFTSNASRRVFSIWDAGGNDTLNLSGFITPSVIDLREEAFSSAGTRNDGGAMLNNISIAKGAVVENAIGGEGADQITGNGANNALTGNGAEDGLSGLAGNDTLDGGIGNDMLSGGMGADSYVGGDGFDYARYDDAAHGDIVVSMNNAANAILGTSAAQGDSFSGIEGLIMGSGNDWAYGDTAANYIYGQGGNDNLFGSLGADFHDGGAGLDYARFDDASYGALQADLAGANSNTGAAAGDVYVNIEGLILTGFGDAGFGDDGFNYLYGLGGNDTLDGRGGDDYLDGGIGNDRLIGGAGRDVFQHRGVGHGTDTVTDFQGGTGLGDQANLQGMGFANFAAVLAASVQVGANLEIRSNATDKLVLLNFSISNLAADDVVL
jgi:Ca2+-binding RTX toxin-like protein